MLEQFMRSWPTLIVGLVILTLTIAFIFKMITLEEFAAILGLLTGGGVALSKTFNVGGTGKLPPVEQK